MADNSPRSAAWKTWLTVAIVGAVTWMFFTFLGDSENATDLNLRILSGIVTVIAAAVGGILFIQSRKA